MQQPPEPSDAGNGEDVGYRGPTACHAAGISYRQLDYWARTGLVVPSVRDATGSGSQRLYSFRDIVVLKVVKRLLDAGVSLQNIRKAIDTLRSRRVADLAGITLISDGTTVSECRSPAEAVDLLQGGQGVFGIAISVEKPELLQKTLKTGFERIQAVCPAAAQGYTARSDEWYKNTSGDPAGDLVLISIAVKTPQSLASGGYAKFDRTMRWVDNDWRMQVPPLRPLIIPSVSGYTLLGRPNV